MYSTQNHINRQIATIAPQRPLSLAYPTRLILIALSFI